MAQTKIVKGGVYRHFKGELYRVKGLATHTETGDLLVIYKSATHDGVTTWARPFEMFSGKVDGEPRFKLLQEVSPVQAEEDWIPVDKDMPDEYDSVFTRFYGTDKWRDGMWLKSSARVLVTVEFEDGTRLTETAKTIDGKWATENHIRKRTVLAWKKMPKEYKGK